MAETDPPIRHAHHRRHRRGEGSVRETMEHIIIAFVLAFVFRAFVVEAFVIPTGSMAPTLLGEHLRQRCPACGYRFELAAGSGGADCPMCEYPIDPAAPRLDSGDRILVLKYVYAFREPERWDVVVFKNPEQPEVNYIKRLVGLPGEELRILAGNIYTRPLGPGDRPPPDDEPWVIQRKDDRVQRAVWHPVYHSDYFPLDGGGPGPRSERRFPWRVPWRAAGESAESWSFDRRGPRWRFDDPAGRPGVLDFDFRAGGGVAGRDLTRNLYTYNMLSADNGRGYGMLEDMRVAATVLPEEDGGRFTLTGSSREMLLRAVVEADGRVLLQSTPRNAELGDGAEEGRWVTRAESAMRPPRAGRATRLELWHADHALSFWADGRRIARWEYEADLGWLTENHRGEYTPAARVAVEGAAVALRSVNLCRDLYYTQTDRRDALGSTAEPAVITSDRFFCLGDNSPQSKDSRLWDLVDPWVEDLTDVPIGYVPRDLMIGKAFFVYFPAPWRLTEGAIGLIPDFGSMRLIR